MVSGSKELFKLSQLADTIRSSILSLYSEINRLNKIWNHVLQAAGFVSGSSP